ncbi:MAG TPA: hypothetical protein VNR68_09020 [Sphingomicrobium sp.]|nr:hypothetical protein [Sphingomicrobium sp.]
MIDRHLLGDAGVAVLLALPTAILARPSADVSKHAVSFSAPQVQLASADRSMTRSRFSLPG